MISRNTQHVTRNIKYKKKNRPLYFCYMLYVTCYMKIVIDARFFGTETGIGRYVKELIENLERVDLENQYVIFLSAKNFELYRPQNPNFQKKLADIKWYSLAEQFKIGRLVDAERADLAHFPHFNVPIFCRTPYIVTIHDLILRHFPTSAASTKNPIIFYVKYFAYNFILKMAIRRARKIIVPSYFVRNDIIKHFASTFLPLYKGEDRGGGFADKIRVIYEGLANLPRTGLGEEYLKAKGIAPPYLLYIGNCYPHKNLEKLIEAFEIISPTYPPPQGGGGTRRGLQLVLVGKRDYFSKRLEENITKRYTLNAKRCIFYGYATDEELSTLYKHAALYVFPSLMEGFGLPPLEALSFGLPSAVSDIPVFHEILGEAAFYFNPNDPADMAAAITDALQNTESRSKILEEGRRVLSRYNRHNHAEKIKETYNAARISVHRGDIA